VVGICSGAGCVYNPAKMRTDCTTADARCMGTCGAGCDLQCSGGAICKVALAAGGAFDCKGATCDITVEDPTATVECSGSAMCNITCKGPCSYACQKMSTCNVTCGSQPPTTVMMDGACM
jgi:hypothetical protein